MMTHRTKRHMPITLLAILLISAFTAPAAQAQSEEEGRLIGDIFKAKGKGRQSCSQALKVMRHIRDDHPAYHFVFTGRKDSTITGIRGCGYAWNTDLARAQAAALGNCKKYEVEFGTGNGEKTCRLMR